MTHELELVRPDMLVDSRAIGERLENQHENVIGLIQTHLIYFESFGVLRFETGKPPEGSLGGRPQRYALLNEDQCYFLLSLSRNSETVVTLKVGLVKAFRQARDAATPVLDMTDPLILAQRFIEAETQRRALAQQNTALMARVEVMTPKAEDFDAYIGTEGLHDFNSVAKVIKWGRNKMLAELRRLKVLMTGGDRQNVPYQQYIDAGYFEIKVRHINVLGFERVSTTTYVTPKGTQFLARRLVIPGSIQRIDITRST